MSRLSKLTIGLTVAFFLAPTFTNLANAQVRDPQRFAEYQQRLAERRANALALRAQRSQTVNASNFNLPAGRFSPSPALNPFGNGFRPSLSGSSVQPALSGFVPQPALRGFVPQPALRGFVPQPALRGFTPRPALRGFVPQPALRGFTPRPALSGFTPRPALGG
ncbi:MAG: hypothetical protein AAF802_23170 [Planctomycetota bacterium]